MISLRKTAQKLTIHFDLLTVQYEMTNMLMRREIKRRHAEITLPRVSAVTEQSSSRGVGPSIKELRKGPVFSHHGSWSFFSPSSARQIVTEGSISHTL